MHAPVVVRTSRCSAPTLSAQWPNPLSAGPTAQNLWTSKPRFRRWAIGRPASGRQVASPRDEGRCPCRFRSSLYASYVTIYAWLSGSGVDVAALARLFPAGDPRVDRIGDETYLTSADLDALFDDPGKLLEAASSALLRLNGLARALDPTYRPVRLVGRFANEAGTSSVVATAETVEIRFHAFAAGVVTDEAGREVPSSGPSAVELLNVVANQPDAVEVLALLGEDRPHVDWFDLYKVFEIIRDNVGGESSLCDMPWIVPRQMKAFAASANNPGVSGRTGRHARPRGGGTPSNTMTIHEARTWISQLVVSWLSNPAPGP